MPKDTTVDTDVTADAKEFREELKNALTALVPAVVPVKPARKLSFEQWAARKPKIKAHHVSGMRAFVKSPEKPRTEDEWNALFENY